jgi:hypothetical protein
MKQLKVKLLLIFLSLPFILSAQVMPTLVFNPDPQSFGMGMSGVSLTTNDPLGFYFNPAKLGYSAQNNNLSFQFYPQKTNWTGFDGYKYSNSGISVGYNFNKQLNGLNLSAGLGFISSNMDYIWSKSSGRSQLSDWIDGYDKYNAIGLGVSLDYYINLAIGLTYKSFNSKFPQIISEGMPSAEAKTNAIDWGLLLNIPISKLAINDFVYKPVGNTELKPTINLSLGYSRSNIGKEIFYIAPDQGVPLPLTARLGYTLSLGADLHYKGLSINFMNFDFTVEAEDLLVNYYSYLGFSYQGIGGDIKPWQNLIELKQTDNVILRRGLKLSLFETISFLFGSFKQGNPNYPVYLPYYEGSGYSNKTNGIIFSTNGLFKLLLWDSHDNPYSNFILQHIEIQYIAASLKSISIFYPHDLLQTDIHTVSVSFNKFIF